jgi:hypothetical protein
VRDTMLGMCGGNFRVEVEPQGLCFGRHMVEEVFVRF